MMRFPALWSRTVLGRAPALALVGALGLAVGTAAPAHATFLTPPGIPLGELVDGGSFTTSNELTFSDFEVEAGSLPSHKLDVYRVFPLDDGFKLFSPLFGLLGSDADLTLSYAVEAPDGMAVKSASLAVFGVSLGGGSGARMSVFDENGQELADLSAFQHGLFGHGDHGDFAQFPILAQQLLVDEIAGVKSGLFAALLGVRHHFQVVSVPEIPEPGTALMLGAGLAGLALVGRRRG